MPIGYDYCYQRAVISLSHLNRKRRGAPIARILAALLRVVYPCDIDPNAMLGDIRIPHATGIVIGCSAIIEDDVTIMSGVVVGSRYGRLMQHGHRLMQHGHAHVKKGAILGANSCIIGTVTIGRGAQIGAGAVVTKDVPDGAIVVNTNQIIGYCTMDNMNQKEI